MPKMDALPEGGAFIAGFAVRLDEEDEPRLRAEEVDLVVGSGYLVTVRDGPLGEVEEQFCSQILAAQVSLESPGFKSVVWPIFLWEKFPSGPVGGGRHLARPQVGKRAYLWTPRSSSRHQISPPRLPRGRPCPCVSRSGETRRRRGFSLHREAYCSPAMSQYVVVTTMPPSRPFYLRWGSSESR
jgi:hypothetical protein